MSDKDDENESSVTIAVDEVNLRAAPQYINVLTGYVPAAEPSAPERGWRIWLDVGTGALMAKGASGKVTKLLDP